MPCMTAAPPLNRLTSAPFLNWRNSCIRAVGGRTHGGCRRDATAPEQMDPTVHAIIASGLNYSAVDAFRAEYLRAELAQKIQRALGEVDALVVPTSPTIHTSKR